MTLNSATALNASRPMWDALPSDAIERVLAFSQSSLDLLAAAGVSRDWRKVAKHPGVVAPQLRKLGLGGREIAKMGPEACWQALCVIPASKTA